VRSQRVPGAQEPKSPEEILQIEVIKRAEIALGGEHKAPISPTQLERLLFGKTQGLTQKERENSALLRLLQGYQESNLPTWVRCSHSTVGIWEPTNFWIRDAYSDIIPLVKVSAVLSRTTSNWTRNKT
jgi:hypothetical protein